MRSAPQKQPIPTITCSKPSGNGGFSGVPSTAWRSATGISSSQPGSAEEASIIDVLLRSPNMALRLRRRDYGPGNPQRQPEPRWRRCATLVGVSVPDHQDPRRRGGVPRPLLAGFAALIPVVPIVIALLLSSGGGASATTATSSFAPVTAAPASTLTHRL